MTCLLACETLSFFDQPSLLASSQLPANWISRTCGLRGRCACRGFFCRDCI